MSIIARISARIYVTNVEQPICDEHRKPARFRVVKDLQKESALKEVGLLLENCRGQGYDGVSAMSSESKGVSGRILQQNPKALMVVISL